MNKDSWIQTAIKELIDELGDLHASLFVDDDDNQGWIDDDTWIDINVRLYEICSYLKTPLLKLNIYDENEDITCQISFIIGCLKKLLWLAPLRREN